MKQQIVFTIITQDKPGIVTTIADTVNQLGGSWLDSRMSQLAGEFTGIVHVEIESGNKSALETALHNLESQGITVNIRQLGTKKTTQDHKLHQIEIVGTDRAGIVAEVTKLFSEKEINILEFDTQITDASMSGGMLFHADAVIGVESDIKLDDLTDKLHDLADELTLDIEWTSHI